jgi:hypothetical protein
MYKLKHKVQVHFILRSLTNAVSNTYDLDIYDTSVMIRSTMFEVLYWKDMRAIAPIAQAISVFAASFYRRIWALFVNRSFTTSLFRRTASEGRTDRFRRISAKSDVTGMSDADAEFLIRIECYFKSAPRFPGPIRNLKKMWMIDYWQYCENENILQCNSDK